MSRRDPAAFTIKRDATLRDAALCIDRNRTGIALVVDDDGALVDTITDGDIRRAVLAGGGIDRPVSELSSRRANSVYRAPVVGRVDDSDAALQDKLRDGQVRQLPLVDGAGRVVDLVVVEDFGGVREPLALSAVVMAGGFGTRLGALTQNTPKPMLPVGDRPLLEHIVDQLRDAGIHRVNVTTHFRGDVIKDHFQDGARFGVDISYVSESQPLGTAGALSLLPAGDEPLLVMNGDILTRLDVRGMLRFHREHRADLTVAVRQYEVAVPFGVVDAEGALVTAIREKPTQRFLVNAGIYLLEPQAVALVPAGARMDMPDLINALLARGRVVASFPVVEYWLDVGRPDDYARAQSDAAVVTGRERA